MAEIAMVIEATTQGCVMVSGRVIDDTFIFAKWFKDGCTWVIAGKAHTFYVDERCVSGLSRKQVIAICHSWLFRPEQIMLLDVDDSEVE